MKYRQLTEGDRVRIEAWVETGCSASEVARKLGVHRSTISRELKRPNTPNGYHALSAQVRYEKAREACRPKRLEETSVFGYVNRKLRKGWSPEEISGRIDREIQEGKRPPSDAIHHETIYRFVYESEYGKREKLYEYLRRGKKHRTKKYGRRSQKTLIPNRVFIEMRPVEVETRATVGHWEGDAILYPHKEAIYNHLERKTRFTVLTKLERKTAEKIEAAAVNALGTHYAKTLTMDNDPAHVTHEKIAKQLKLETYFCHPYHSWEKGSNENMNGVVRQYFPRGKSIQAVTQAEINDVADELNSRPRKCLAYATPAEMLQSEYQNLQTVALSLRM